MKEWQRWEAMAEDFASVGDHRREAECLEMALEILPPGHHDVKTRMREHLEAALTRERDVVERIRKSKLDLERRTADAEAQLEELRSRSLINRLLGRHDD